MGTNWKFDITLIKNMEKVNKYYSLLMNYRKEVFNEFKRYCESRKVNLDRSRKYKSLFPLNKQGNGYIYYYSYLDISGYNSIFDFIKDDKRFSLKSRKEYSNFRKERIKYMLGTYCNTWYRDKSMWWRYYYALYDSSLSTVISTYVPPCEGNNRLIYRLRDVIKYKMQPIKNKQ